MKRVGIILLMLSLGAWLDLQAQTATVSGTITQNGAPAVDLRVSIGDKFSFTDVRGRYRIADVPFGTHTMRIARGGTVLTEVTVNVNQANVTVDVAL